MKREQAGFGHHLILIIIPILAIIGLAGWMVWQKQHGFGGMGTSKILEGGGTAKTKAIEAGKVLSGGKCEGEAKVKLTHLPMKESDFSVLIPYGLVVGGHVTPIDHQYFGPADYKSPRDAYPVYAMADARITEIQPRTTERGTEYRFVFTVSCTSLYYYDLVTSLSGKVKAAYEQNPKDINLAIRAGDQLGAIGGQTLDFAVWDTEKPLKGFINPASYDGEAWKMYTADPYDYYTPALRALLIERNPRTVEPIAGKIDYDIDGKLIGNWFIAGTGGYNNGGVGSEYWSTHLSIAPNHYDPTVFIISLGNFGGTASQFAAVGNAPDPATVGPDSGLVKYELSTFSYTTAEGNMWMGNTVIKNPKVKINSISQGCLLVQLSAKRTLKAESFPKQTCPAVAGFSGAAKTYSR